METDFTQRWRERKAFFVQNRRFFNPRIHDVARVEEKLAREFVAREHYLPDFPSAKLCIGLFRHDKLTGIAVFGTPQHNNTILKTFNVTNVNDGVVLSRIVLLDTEEMNAESYFLARCREMLKSTGYVGLVTFSDDNPKCDASGNVIFPGHLGIQFRAGNAVYLGRSSASAEYLFADGSVLSNRAYSKLTGGESGWRYVADKFESRGANPCPAATDERSGWANYWRAKITRKMRSPGKLKYAWSLHPKIVLPPGLPYPRYRFVDVQTKLNF